MSELRSKFVEETEVLEGKMDARLTTLRNQLNLKHKLELAEVNMIQKSVRQLTSDSWRPDVNLAAESNVTWWLTQ